MDTLDECSAVVVSGVPEVLPATRMRDKLIIYFQRSKSHGGDVANVLYPTTINGVAFVIFEEAEDAQRVVDKREQVISDREFPKDYHLTVFKFTPNVFFYVNKATVDLSAFSEDEGPLIQDLRLAHRSVRFLPWPQQQKAIVEGPFTAIRALREDLLCRAGKIIDQDQSSVATPLSTMVLRDIHSPNRTPHQERTGHSHVNNPKVMTSEEKVYSAGLVKSGESPLIMDKAAGDQAFGGDKEKSILPQSWRKSASDHPDYEKHILEKNKAQPRSPSSSNFKDIPSFSTTWDTVVSPGRSFGYVVQQGGTDTGVAFKSRDMDIGLGSVKSRLDQSYPKETPMGHYGVVECTDSHQVHTYSLGRPRHTPPASMSDRPHSSPKDRLGTPVRGTDHVLSRDVSHESTTGHSQPSTSDAVEEKSIWIESNTFRYLKKLRAEELKQCWRQRNVCVSCEEGPELTHVRLRGCHAIRDLSDVMEATADILELVNFWQNVLRVHTIEYDVDKSKNVTQVCDYVNDIFQDVLYTVEDSSIKVIGPSISTHLFSKWVKDRIADEEES